MRALLLAAALALSACAGAPELVETALGPATTAPQQVYRLAGAYDIVLKRLAVAPAAVITPRVRLAETRADGAVKEAYAAVSASNAPPTLTALVDEAATAVAVLAATAKITAGVQGFPSLDPAGLSAWLLGKVVNARPVAALYRAEIDALNQRLNEMFVDQRDPSAEEWAALWASLAAGRAALARR